MTEAARRAAADFTNGDVFLWGGIGGFAICVVIFVLPALTAAQRAGNLSNWTKTKAWLTLGLLILYSGLGSIGAFAFGDKPSTIRGALIAGLQAPTALKAVLAAGKEMLPKSPDETQDGCQRGPASPGT